MTTATVRALPPSMLKAWKSVGPLMMIRNEAEYDRAVATMDSLLVTIGGNERHPAREILHTLGTIVHAYDEEHHQIPHVSGIDVLRELMREHDLTQSDLPEVGTQATVSLILNGKRNLTLDHIKALSKRFRVSPTVFID